MQLKGPSNFLDPPSGHLLVFSPNCKARRGEATIKGGHTLVCGAEDATFWTHALRLITPMGALDLVVGFKAPKSGFRILSDFFTLRGLQYSLMTGRPYPRPICTCEALEMERRGHCQPLQLVPPVTGGGTTCADHLLGNA